MANRNIDTGFYKSPFVRGLSGALKGLYGFIICDCSGAGIWAKDLPIASVYVGFDFSEKEFDEAFVKTGKAIDLGDGKYFFPDFIEHQYPKGFSRNNPAQKNFISELEKYGLLNEDLTINLEGLQSPSEAPHVTVTVPVTVRKRGAGEKLKDIPTLEDFMAYAKQASIYTEAMDFGLTAKYHAWKDAGWKDGFGKPIKAWKSKLMNTMPHIKPSGARQAKQPISQFERLSNL